MAVVVAVELVATFGIALRSKVTLKVKAANRSKGIVQHVKVQILVAVVVKENGVGAQSFVCHAVGFRLFFKRSIALVDEKFIAAVRPRYVARVAYVNIQPAVGIDVRHGDACAPCLLAFHT